MTASTIFFIALVVACPLLMIWMMRGGHGHGADAGGVHEHDHSGCGGHGQADSDSSVSLDELRRQRDELDRSIEEREAEEQSLTPAGGARR